MFSSMPWPVYVLLLGILAIPVAIVVAGQLKVERLKARAGLEELSRMALPEFLKYLTNLFAGLGYHVDRPPAQSGYGIDLILTDGTGRRTAVQASRYDERVAAEAIRELSEGAGYHRCQDALLVSLKGFAGPAVTMAEETGAMLWDLADLADAMDKVRSRPSFGAVGAERRVAPAAGRQLPAERPAPVSPELPADPPPPEEAGPKGPPCPICRKPMEPRVAAGREIWLCSRFPRCNGAKLKDEV